MQIGPLVAATDIATSLRELKTLESQHRGRRSKCKPSPPAGSDEKDRRDPVARAFVRNVPPSADRDIIAGRQVLALRKYQGPWENRCPFATSKPG